MLGRLILAVLFCLSALAAVNGTFAAPAGHEAMIGVASLGSGSGPDASDTDASRERQWSAGHSREASITGSIWRSQAHHAELAGASHSHGVVIAPREATAPGSRFLPPHHARNIPLLI